MEQRLRAREALLMFEGRRIGKTSVAVAALDRISADGRVAVATLTRFRDERAATRFVVRQFESGPSRAARTVASLLGRVRPDQLAAAGSQVAAEASIAGELATASDRDVASMADLVSETDRRNVTAVLLDEAHALLDWPASSQRALNAALRGSLGVGIVFTSSDRNALSDLTRQGGPLHLAGSRVRIPAIGRGEWFGALRDRFAGLRIEVAEALIQDLLEITGGHPYLTMRLARDLARLASAGPGPRWEMTGAVLEAARYELRSDPVWTELNGAADD